MKAPLSLVKFHYSVPLFIEHSGEWMQISMAAPIANTIPYLQPPSYAYRDIYRENY